MIPNKLKKGDTIGVVAPSNCIKEDDLEYINASIALMEGLGLKVKFGSFVFQDNLRYGTSPEKRAKDINSMFADQEVKAIICAKGGEDSNSTLDYIDYNLIKKNPKIICGFSDNTSILNVINNNTGLVTFHGPTFKSLTSWETGYAYNQFIKTFFEKDTGEENDNIAINNTKCSEDIIGEKDDEYITIKEGKAEGELIGGNLSLSTKLVCGKHAVDTKGKILFLEELGFESSPQMVNSNIYYLKQNGVFENIVGLWIGNYEHISKISLEDVIINVLESEYKFPIIKSDNFGHIDKKSIIPIGAKAKIDTDEKIKIKLTEKCITI